MSSWAQSVASAGSPFRVFRRCMGHTEQFLYNGSLINGSTDCVQHISFEFRNVYSEDDIRDIWRTLKHRFPLLGARVVEHGLLDEVELVIEERSLDTIRDGELTFLSKNSKEAVLQEFEDVMNGQRRLTQDLLAGLTLIRRTDVPNLYHLFVNIAHFITDYQSNATVSRVFLNMLAMSPRRPAPLDQDLSDTLAKSISWEAQCSQVFSPARARWRSAIAKVLQRRAAAKLQGGHTLPTRINPSASLSTPLSKYIVVSISPADTARILAGCRARSHTFGHALPVLAQVALSRVLHRRHLRGEITDAELDARLKQPMHDLGTLDLRAAVDRVAQWCGVEPGEERVFPCFGYMLATLPFLPHAPTAASQPAQLDHTGAPSFATLLSRGRFSLRCASMTRQMEGFRRHPLLLEFARAMRGPAEVARNRDLALQWRANGRLEAQPSSMVFTQIACSLGNTDALLPINYPLPLTSRGEGPMAGVESPVLHVRSFDVIVRSRPANLYLNARSTDGKMYLNVYFDGNVFADQVVEEWLGEIKDAALWYLAQSWDRGQARL